MDIKAELKKPQVLVPAAGIGCAALVLLFHRATSRQQLNTYPAVQSAGTATGDTVPAPADGQAGSNDVPPAWAEQLVQAIQGLQGQSTQPGSQTGQQPLTTGDVSVPGGYTYAQALAALESIQGNTLSELDTATHNAVTTLRQFSSDAAYQQLLDQRESFESTGANYGNVQAFNQNRLALEHYISSFSGETVAPFIPKPLAPLPPSGTGGGFVPSLRPSKKSLRQRGDELAYQHALLRAGWPIDVT